MKPLCNSAAGVPAYNLCVTLCLIFLSLNTHAQQSAAIIIGISQYKEVTPLQFADRDAVAFAEFLKTQQVPEDNIKLFLNESATRFNIVDELYNLTETLQPKDRFYFYFGGHGDLEAKISHENSLLLLYNSFKTGYFQGNEYLQLSELKTWFEAMTKKGVEVVFIADACHSGGLIGGKEGVTKTQLALQESWAGITKILSCKSDEFSLEGKQWGGGRGIFSYHLVNGLTGLADANKDKKVTLTELNKYLSVNVLREADPNVQTPVVQGNNKQLLAKTEDASLKKLRDDLMRSVPIITEVNIKAKEGQMIGKLDKSLVETFNKFRKALDEKRLNTFDNEKDYALLHYRKLVAAKIPNNLLTIIKRNLGAALMERELALLKNAREKGSGSVVRIENQLNSAIANLDEAMKIFGVNHYANKFLKARKLVLMARTNFPRITNLSNKNSVDEYINTPEQERLKYYFKERQLLIQSLALEPNMISTYALLSSNYRETKNTIHPSKFEAKAQMQDSSIYYQEKVVELLPNQAQAHFNLAINYPDKPFSKNLVTPHPKAMYHLEQVITLDSNFIQAYSLLAFKCDDITVKKYQTAIKCYERILRFDEAKTQQYLKQGNDEYLKAIASEKLPNPVRQNAASICVNYLHLYLLHKIIGDTGQANKYWQILNEKIEQFNITDLNIDIASVLVRHMNESFRLENLSEALFFAQKALNDTETKLKTASENDKPLLSLKYQDKLKILGSIHKNLGNYDQAETYLKQALAYPVLPGLFTGKIKFMGGESMITIDTLKRVPITIPHQLRYMGRDNQYQYGVEANFEMYELKMQQGKTDEAFEWLEKAFQFALTENGNDTSGEPFEIYFVRDHPDLKDRFKSLKAKYFPPTEKK